MFSLSETVIVLEVNKEQHIRSNYFVIVQTPSLPHLFPPGKKRLQYKSDLKASGTHVVVVLF